VLDCVARFDLEELARVGSFDGVAPPGSRSEITSGADTEIQVPLVALRSALARVESA
jgi:hypothetical protein